LQLLVAVLNLILYNGIAAVQEKLLRTEDDFIWSVDTPSVGRYIIDVEFLDLKINVSFDT